MKKRRSLRGSQDVSKMQSRLNKEKGIEEEAVQPIAEVKKRKTLKRLSWEIMTKCIVTKILRKGLPEFKDYDIAEAIARTDKERRDILEQGLKYRHLTFGLSRFKSRQDHFPNKAVKITWKKPEWRTQEELKYIRSLLQPLPSFQKYSSDLQLMLAKVIRFERFGRRRVILKMGHPGHSFYFIYSGAVAITKDKDGASAFIDSEPIILRRGFAFGEVALIKDSHRNATVVCMEETELLAVDKEDFFANKLDLLQANELKYRYDFFRSLDLFASWSDQLIENIVGRCKTHRYHYGEVIIWDSNATNSLIFISKGSCELLRLVDLTDCPSYHKWLSKHTDQHLPPTQSQPKPVAKKRFEKIPVKSHYMLDPIYERAPLHQKPDRLHIKNTEESQKVLPLISTEVTHWQREKPRRPSSRPHEIPHPDPMMNTPYGKIHKGFAASVYLKVNVLQEGDCFGLHQHLIPHRYQDKRRMVLVSKGTEIIKLKREKFDELVDATTISSVGRMERAFPTDDKLCQIFLEQNRWKIFKKDLLEMLMECKPATSKRDTKSESHSFIQFSIDLNQAGMLDLLSASQKHRQGSYFIPLIWKGKGRAESLPGVDTRLIHGINIPGTRVPHLLK
ncbi:cyclic nucleotide-binding domain-containing protein 2-like [Ambystoma mexicanum]|uniref:cyclic nucleotide-binding domain-containing protein 2-like n=1 Tax=Ambystoma mexicanum TaxID=8296 RepID=UPI0037E91AF5